MVKLKDFIEIAPNIIEPYLCSVMIETEDEYFGTTMKTVLKHFSNISQLKDYYDYEIFGFDQDFNFGEIEEQYISLRKIV